MILHGLDYKVLAVVILLQQRLTVNLNIKRHNRIQRQILLKNLVDEIILTEQGKSNVFHEGG